MASVVTEHIILLAPAFFAMMIFGLVANAVTANYSAQQRLIIIGGAENQLTTTISQLFYTINQVEIQNGTIIKTSPLPEFIDGQDYFINGTLRGNTLILTFNFPGIPLKENTLVNLGTNAEWDSSSILHSNNKNAAILVKKYYNTTIRDERLKLSFR